MRAACTIPMLVALVTAGAAEALDVSRFGMFEESFTHTGSPANPYRDVTATATLTPPAGGARSIPLFWDGGTTWKLRFSPDATGSWSWSVASSDAGLDGQSGSFTCVASMNRGSITAMGSAPYHFQYEDGTPMWFMGDTMWRAGEHVLSESLDRASYFHYVDVRAAQGFNYVHANVGRCALRLLDGGGNEGGVMFDGSVGGTVNPGYFQELDTRVAYTNQAGITLGYVLGWSQDWAAFASAADRLLYTRYVVARYSAYNVVFIVAGEYNEELTADDYRDIAAEIEAHDPHGRMRGIHATGKVETFATEGWMDFGDYQQTYTALHSSILDARDHNRPVVNSEYAYYLRDSDGDGTCDKPNSATLTEIRQATWDLVMAGGYFVTGWGTTYHGGYRDPGPFDVDATKNDDFEEDVQHVKTLFTALTWWTLQPDDSLVTGAGTTYCLYETGQQYVVYVRDNGGTIDLTLNGAASTTYNVRRFDPRTGSVEALTTYTGTGPVTLSPPDVEDCVFVLTTTGGTNSPPTASISADITSVLPGETVTFSVAASDPDGTIASHEWHWDAVDESGAGAPPSTATRSWAAEGTYDVSLSVTDDGAPAQTVKSNTVTITVSANSAPVIDAANVTPTSGDAPLSVTFSASATDADGDALTYTWDFDADGAPDAVGPTAMHTYPAAGHYDPVLTVSDGTSAPVTMQLTVDAEAPSAGTSSVDVTAEADTYVYETNPDTAYGSETSIAVGGGTATRVAYLRFDVTGLPAGATVTAATLSVRASNSSSEAGGGGTIRAFAPTVAAWDESAPTWNAPLAGSDASGDLCTLGPVSTGSAYEFSGLGSAVAGNGLVTFVIRSTAQDGAAYCSREHATVEARPTLTVTYALAASGAPVITASPVADPNPVGLADAAGLDVIAVDPDGDALTYVWSKQGGPGTVAFGANGSSSGVSSATFGAVGEYTIRVTVYDPGGGYDEGEVTVTVVATTPDGGGGGTGGGASCEPGGSSAALALLCTLAFLAVMRVCPTRRASIAPLRRTRSTRRRP